MCIRDREIIIELIAALFEYIGHIQRRNRRHAEKFKLNGQIQAALKVVCVDNIDYQIGLFVYEKTERRALFVRERA